MVHDEKIADKVYELDEAVHKWIEYVEGAGSQCSYSDRLLEKILEVSTSLQSWYDGNHA